MTSSIVASSPIPYWVMASLSSSLVINLMKTEKGILGQTNQMLKSHSSRISLCLLGVISKSCFEMFLTDKWNRDTIDKDGQPVLRVNLALFHTGELLRNSTNNGFFKPLSSIRGDLEEY